MFAFLRGALQFARCSSWSVFECPGVPWKAYWCVARCSSLLSDVVSNDVALDPSSVLDVIRSIWKKVLIYVMHQRLVELAHSCEVPSLVRVIPAKLHHPGSSTLRKAHTPPSSLLRIASNCVIIRLDDLTCTSALPKASNASILETICAWIFKTPCYSAKPNPYRLLLAGIIILTHGHAL